jgi:rubredoxin
MTTFPDIDDDFDDCPACGGDGFTFSHIDFRMLVDEGAELRALEIQRHCPTCAGQGVVRRTAQ